MTNIQLFSKKIKSVSQLNQVMAGDFAWRKKELTNLKWLVENNKKDQFKDLAVRCGVTVLYSHWEGFIKTIACAYFEYVSRCQANYGELADCFLAAKVRSMILEASQGEQIEPFVKLVNFFRSDQDKRSNIPTKRAINTQSNLNFAVFKNILMTLGLDPAPYVTKEHLIDEKLLQNRNSIAHGEYLIVDSEEFLDLHDEIKSMMQLFYDQVDNAAATGAHMLPVSPKNA